MSNYVDDNQLYFTDRNLEVVKSVINGDLPVASRSFDDNLALNPEKCKYIIPSKNYPCNLSFSVSDAQIPIVDHLKLLGLTMNISLIIAVIHTTVTEEKYPPTLEEGLCVIFALLYILIVK